MNRQGGFSLLELLCVLAILSLFAYAGSAQFLVLSQSSQDKSTIQNGMKKLSDALTQARQLAVVSGQTSYLCGGIECDGDWSSGFVLYQNNLSSGNYASSDKTYQGVSFDENLNVYWQGFPINKQQIEFQSDGLSGYQNGTFEFCLNAWQASLILNQSGRFYITDPQEKEEGACL
ncbi:pilus assembly protein FimT [Marinomonas ushuaiensis DSM 15871]|uniref:Type II secretion system protein H n=1 Tax=Marinomonas ushuaiensis DSM 15871 TaxID=1122207 RepID=X7E799_9GAMM|nr:GspH/FimT family pseudopilin [Marinomonas ushuaiensis]ETX11033.1 pilus assembly protein FimT [Marinomonas ushuaiensis DSM 15871]